MSASATGSIMSAVAVLLIHALMNVVATITASTTRRPLVPPMTLRATWAMRRWAPQYSAARESMKPPKNNRMSGSPYAPAALSVVSTPASGKITTGTSAVADSGSASNTHQIAQSVATAAVQDWAVVKPACCVATNATTAISTPPTRDKKRADMWR